MNIFALYAGQPAPLGPRGAPSAIVKSAVAQLTVSLDGTVEDQQANKKLHGGPEKVLHQYSFEGYKQLSEAFEDIAFTPGSIGENLLVEGMNDQNVYIGDTYQMGEVVVQVSAPRAPCVKISQRYEHKNLDRFVGQQGITGWYYRVVRGGVINAGDTVSRLARVEHTVSVAELMQSVYNKAQAASAADFSTLAILDDEWREKCRRAAHKAGQD